MHSILSFQRLCAIMGYNQSALRNSMQDESKETFSGKQHVLESIRWRRHTHFVKGTWFLQLSRVQSTTGRKEA